MSAKPLKKLSISKFRGSTGTFALPFESGKKLTLLYGENGTGKSTVCDAMEFLGKGKIGSLEARGLGTTHAYWPALGKGHADMSVILQCGDEICTAKMEKREVVVAPPALRPRIEVLRRAQILGLVEALPSERYAAIQRFVDVNQVETSEGALRDLIKGLRDSQKTAIARVGENQSALTTFWDAAGKPDGNPFVWAKKESAADTTGFAAEEQQINVLESTFQALQDIPEKFVNANAILEKTRMELMAAQSNLSEKVQAAAQGAADVVSILEAAKEYFLNHKDSSKCPLCESSENMDGLEDRISQRLSSFEAVRGAKQREAVARNGVPFAEEKVKSTTEEALKKIRSFNEKLGAMLLSDVAKPSTPAPESLDALAAWIQAAASLRQKWKEAKEARYDKKRFVATLKAALSTYQENYEAQKDLEKLLPRLELALRISEDERRKLTDEILGKISGEVGRLYEQVHPGEGLEKISLALDPKKRASLDIESSFSGQSIPPQAYLSESHLDTLGLCIFLALAAMDSPAETILVLDDVLASVDEPHVDRLIEMLYAETLKFRHCIIATHYRPWKQKLRWGWLKNGQCQFVELSQWTLADGMRITRSIPDVARLRQLLGEEAPDPQLVSSKAGVILEATLDFLTILYQCSVPRKPEAQYTLGELLPALNGKLKPVLRVEVMTGKDAAGIPRYESRLLAACLDELARIAQVRNVMGCHFNQLSYELLDADAIRFATQVLLLVDTLVDEDAGWPRSDKSGSYWATSGETRRLHPLKKPS